MLRYAALCCAAQGHKSWVYDVCISPAHDKLLTTSGVEGGQQGG